MHTLSSAKPVLDTIKTRSPGKAVIWDIWGMGRSLGPNRLGMPAKQALFAFPSDRFLAWPLGHALKELTNDVQ